MPTMELTDKEATWLQRIRINPDQRRAELAQRTAALRQRLPADPDRERIESLSPQARRIYHMLLRQDAIARELENPSLAEAVQQAREALETLKDPPQ